jgi:hypothetical protein
VKLVLVDRFMVLRFRVFLHDKYRSNKKSLQDKYLRQLHMEDSPFLSRLLIVDYVNYQQFKRLRSECQSPQFDVCLVKECRLNGFCRPYLEACSRRYRGAFDVASAHSVGDETAALRFLDEVA